MVGVRLLPLPQHLIHLSSQFAAPKPNLPILGSYKILKDWVNECDVLLALIGPGWINAIDPKMSSRRLDNPSDFVRIEIGEALARDIPVVPVLIDGTPMPDIDLLPNGLKELVDRMAEFVEYRTFDADVERLIKKLRLTHRPVQTVPAQPAVAPPHHASVEDRMRAEGRIKVDADFVHGPPERWFKPGSGRTEWFKDHEFGPELVIVPAGEFLMGSDDEDSEKPVHKVSVLSPFAVGRVPVTFADWDACVADGGCNGYRPDDKGWGRDSRPVVYVSWTDAKLYIDWLNSKTGKIYRLPSEAEREYVTRAGTKTPFWWGTSITPKQANYDSNYTFNRGRKGRHRRQTVPVDSFEANSWGLFNVHGNVFEWCEDIWHADYTNAPTDGSAWLQGVANDRRVVRGGSWANIPQSLRAAYRSWYASEDRHSDLGFRLARTLNPDLVFFTSGPRPIGHRRFGGGFRSARVERDVVPRFDSSGLKHNNTGRFRSCAESSNHGQLANSPALRRPWRTAHLETQNPPWKAGRCPAKPGKLSIWQI
jgi:formylglycine-generating enzyme required for sulfatase activity